MPGSFKWPALMRTNRTRAHSLLEGGHQVINEGSTLITQTPSVRPYLQPWGSQLDMRFGRGRNPTYITCLHHHHHTTFANCQVNSIKIWQRMGLCCFKERAVRCDTIFFWILQTSGTEVDLNKMLTEGLAQNIEGSRPSIQQKKFEGTTNNAVISLTCLQIVELLRMLRIYQDFYTLKEQGVIRKSIYHQSGAQTQFEKKMSIFYPHSFCVFLSFPFKKVRNNGRSMLSCHLKSCQFQRKIKDVIKNYRLDAGNAEEGMHLEERACPGSLR